MSFERFYNAMVSWIPRDVERQREEAFALEQPTRATRDFGNIERPENALALLKSLRDDVRESAEEWSRRADAAAFATSNCNRIVRSLDAAIAALDDDVTVNDAELEAAMNELFEARDDQN